MPPTLTKRIDRKLRKFFKTVHFTVFAISMTIIVAFVLFGVLFQEAAGDLFGFLHTNIIRYFGWYYITIATVFVVFAIWLMFSRYGNIRLGGRYEKPEFSFFAWFALLFSAGMGIGLMFFSIAEPMGFFDSFTRANGYETAEAANRAMMLTFFHWGLHAWAIYVIMALTLAYFAFRFRLPFTIRSIFYPIFGDRIYGPIGHTIDILAIFATLFGLATSLGLGVMQLNTGLNYLIGTEVSVTNQLILIAVITAIAVGSVVSGLHRGLKWFSILNLTLILVLMTFLFIVGPTLFNLRFLIESTGYYLQNIVQVSLETRAMDDGGGRVGTTVFYWAWWMAWSPFVGIFIARVSRGRTIRQFVAGVLLMPTLFVFIWLTVFGGTALHMETHPQSMKDPDTSILETIRQEDGTLDETQALYATLQQLPVGPLTGVLMVIATILIVTYFITSSDSATYVVDALITRGSKRSPTRQRVIWGITEGAIAAVLLYAGGQAALGALQTAAVSTGLPFSIILIGMCYCFYRALRREFDVEGVEWWDEYA